MNEGILTVLLVAIIIGFGVIFYILNQRLKDLKSGSSVDLIKADVT
jgi:hypothetical protein